MGKASFSKGFANEKLSEGRAPIVSQCKKTARGFQIINFKDHNNRECELQQSSAIDDTERGRNNPGSSYVWLGVGCYPERMHLHRGHVKELISVLQGWLKDGKLATREMESTTTKSAIADAPDEVVDAAKEIARASLNTIRNIIAEEFPDVDLDIQKDFVKAVCQFMATKA